MYPDCFKPYKNLGRVYLSKIIYFRHFISFRDYMLKTFHVLQRLYALGISSLLGIICFKYFMSFKDYMLQAFHKSSFVLPKCLHLWYNVKNVSKLNFVCNSFIKEHVSFLFTKRRRHLGPKRALAPAGSTKQMLK